MLRHVNYIIIKLSVKLFFNMLNYLLNPYKGRYMHLNIFFLFGPIHTQTLVLPIKDTGIRVKVAPLVKIGSRQQKARNSKRMILKAALITFMEWHKIKNKNRNQKNLLLLHSKSSFHCFSSSNIKLHHHLTKFKDSSQHWATVTELQSIIACPVASLGKQTSFLTTALITNAGKLFHSSESGADNCSHLLIPFLCHVGTPSPSITVNYRIGGSRQVPF